MCREAGRLGLFSLPGLLAVALLAESHILVSFSQLFGLEGPFEFYGIKRSSIIMQGWNDSVKQQSRETSRQ